MTRIAAAGIVATVVAALVLATSGHLVDPVAYGLQVAVMLAGSVAAALVWRRHRPENGLAAWLLAYAVAMAIVSLQGVRDPVLHSVGVAADPVFFAVGYWLVFAFPEGRVSGRPERLLLGGISLYLVIEFVPWFLFSPVVSGGAPLAGCNASCPANGLMIADRPAIAAGIGTSMYWIVIALMSATIVCLVYRLVTASRPRRRALLPVYVPALMLSVPVLAFHGLAAGIVDFDAGTVSAIGWVLTAGRTLLVFGFLLAIAQASVFAGSALKRLIGELADHPSASRLRDVVASALDDPSLELALKADGGDYVDSTGAPLAGREARHGRATHLVTRRGEAVVALWHDPALDSDPELIGAASQAVLLALDNGRLEAELQASRRQAATAAEGARRKVERDLHDGAQQQLLALQIRVALTRELADRDSAIAAQLTDLGDRLQDVVHELRDLARGARPPVLRDFGLAAALASATQRSQPPAALVTDGLARYPEDVETAVYFCCLESLQNVGKHAGANARAEVRVAERADTLCFDILDDGVGWELKPAQNGGTGLANMTERVAALRGTLTVESPDGHGVRVSGRIPLAAQH